MNRFRLKITGAVVLTLAAIAGGYALWSSETRPTAKSKNSIKLQKEAKSAPKIARRDGVYLEGAQARKFRSRPPKWDQKQSHSIDAETGPQYQDSLETRTGNQQLSKQPRRYYKQYGFAGKKTDSRYPGIAGSEKMGEPPIWQPEQLNARDRAKSLEFLRSLKSKKPVERNKPGLPEGAELKISEEQLKQMNETALLHILDEYKDSPEQASQVNRQPSDSLIWNFMVPHRQPLFDT